MATPYAYTNKHWTESDIKTSEKWIMRIYTDLPEEQIKELDQLMKKYPFLKSRNALISYALAEWIKEQTDEEE